MPIRRAPEQGRLTGFFQIVTQILGTYNSGSAYVSLDDWDGTACRDCGLSVADDEGSTCARCDGTLCDECSCTCEGCQTSYCADCLGECTVCEEGYCRGCLSACAACRRLCCEACLEEGTCAACREPAARRPRSGRMGPIAPWPSPPDIYDLKFSPFDRRESHRHDHHMQAASCRCRGR